MWDFFGTGRGSAGARRENRGLRFFFCSFPALIKTKKVQRYLLVERVLLPYIVKSEKGSSQQTVYRFSPMYVYMYVYMYVHVGGTYLPIPSRSGKDDVDTLGTCM